MGLCSGKSGPCRPGQARSRLAISRRPERADLVNRQFGSAERRPTNPHQMPGVAGELKQRSCPRARRLERKSVVKGKSQICATILDAGIQQKVFSFFVANPQSCPSPFAPETGCNLSRTQMFMTRLLPRGTKPARGSLVII